MSSGARFRRRSLVAGIVLIAGCAQVPPAPAPRPAPAPARPTAQQEQVRAMIARHQQLARKYQQAGDLAGAATQWHILTLLAPEDSGFQLELATVRKEIGRRVHGHLAAGNAALRSGDADRAADEMLRVLALDPGNAEAAKELREIERRRASRTQAARAAKAGGGPGVTAAQRATAARTPATVASEAYDLEQPLETFTSGDTEGGLRELRKFVEDNPDDKAARNKIATTVYDRARELERAGSREEAVALYEQAVALRGEPKFGWASHIQSLKKALGNEYFDKGTRAYPTNVAQAIRDWETSLRYDPRNARAAARLKEARQVPGPQSSTKQ
jgi:tetratricopeptide (TPR) repeat protein